MRQTRVILLLATSLAFVGVEAMKPLQAVALAQSRDWSSLQQYVGKYPHETDFFKSSAIAADLKRLLGRKYKVLMTNFDVQTPITRDGDVLHVYGNAAHEGGINGAYILIAPATQSLEVGLWEERRFKAYRLGKKIAKPAEIKQVFTVYQTPVQ